jgi:3-oxoacyl-[acyl-carrier protein] reductase
MTSYDCFKNKKAVVIGGGSGIGLATTELLLNNYCHALIVGDKNKTLNKAEKELNHHNLTIFKTDVSSSCELKSLAKHIRKEFGQIDYLVNCAGLSLTESKGVLNENGFDKLIEVNMKSIYLSTMILAYPLLKKNGAIVNISSVFGRKGTPTFSSGYAAAKAAVINLTKTYATELAPDIRVNCIAPGATYPTGISKSWSSSLRQKIAHGLPLKKLGRPREIASTIIFLLSDDASFITGQTIDVNGGVWMN